MTSSKLSHTLAQLSTTNLSNSPSQEIAIPHAGKTKFIKSKLSYPSIWEAIQRISYPVSLNSIKQFYGMSYPMRHY